LSKSFRVRFVHCEASTHHGVWYIKFEYGGLLYFTLKPYIKVKKTSKTLFPLYINTNIFFFLFEEMSPPQKAHFVGPGEGVKPRLSQALTKDARPDSNSRPAVQISNPLPSRYTSWKHTNIVHVYLRDR